MTAVSKHDQMRLNNTVAVLNCIREFGPLTKKELQGKTRLSWGSISSITTELLQRKVITESQIQSSFPGRNPKELDIACNNNLTIGIDISAECVVGVVIDLRCRVLDKRKVHLTIDAEPKDYTSVVLNHVRDIIRYFLDKFGRSSIIGVGLAVQGSVDAVRGVSLFSPHIPGWENVNLKGILESEYDLPVLVEHDPNCMALAERWLDGISDQQNVLLIRLSHGIGMSILLNGEVYHGANGNAGEFGHTIVNANGPKCTCGNYGCLESYASGWRLLQKVEEGIRLGRIQLRSRSTETQVTLDTCINLAQGGEPYLSQLFEDMGFYLGLGIGNLVNLFNPDLIIIGGELSKLSPFFMGRLRETTERIRWKNSAYDIQLAKVDGDLAAAIGAGALFIQKVFSGELRFLASA